MKCEKCGSVMKIQNIVKDGKTKPIAQCTVCRFWVGIKCPLCLKEIEDDENECMLSGFVESGDLAHVTCVFTDENKYAMIASMIHEEDRRILAARNKDTATQTEVPLPWYELDPQEKQRHIAVVKILESHFLTWMRGYALAQQIKGE